MPEQTNPRPDKPGTQRPGGPSMKMSRGIVSWLVFFGLALMLVTVLHRQWQPREEIPISDFNKLVANQEIESLVLRTDTITGRRKSVEGLPPEAKLDFFVKYSPNTVGDHAFLKDLSEKIPNAKISREPDSVFVDVMISLLPWVVILAIMWLVFIRQIRNAGAGGGMLGSFGRSRHRLQSKEHTNITFADVAGIQEAQEELQEIIEFLRNPKRFQRLGGRIPRGVLLVGEPGCGKTLLAKAIAGEADVPFFSISGSDFVEMFVGVGASRVRDLFKQAKDNAPCIIFLDEIDAVGRRRGANFGGGGHDEREQTLNAILVEMDGFDTSDQVIVIAATNRVDVLDPALIRPGRFDRQVYVPLPDVQGRYEILKVHARKIKLGPNVDLRRLARGTPMFSGADLAAIINESALIATMAEKEFVEQDDLEEARDKVRWGRAKRSRVIDQKENELTAYHEAGHALVQSLVKGADPVHKVSIIPRGPMGGVTFSLPEKDRLTVNRAYIEATLKVLCAGRIAEELIGHDMNSGAEADIRQATNLAKRMITDWGMSDKLGFVYYGENDRRPVLFDLGTGREYSESTAEVIDREIKRIVDEAYQLTKQLVLDNREKVVTIAKALMKYETITGEEVHALIRGESLDRPSVGDLLDADQRERKVGLARPVSADPKPSPNIGGGPLPQPG